MVQIALIGPVNQPTKELFFHLSDDYTIEFIGFDEIQFDEHFLYSSYQITNFHDLTIDLMDLEPQILIYFPPYLDYKKCEKNSEFAYISNEETIEHLYGVLEIFNTQLIIFSSDQIFGENSTKPKSKNDKPIPKSILGKSIFEGEKIIKNTNKATIIRLSPFEENYEIVPSNEEIQLLSTEMFVDAVSDIIKNKKEGIIHLPGKAVKGKIDRPVSLLS